MEREPLMKAESLGSDDTEHTDGLNENPPVQESAPSYSQLDQWASQAQTWYISQNVPSRSFVTGAIVAGLFLVLYGIFHAASGSAQSSSTSVSHEGAFAPLYQGRDAGPGIFPLDIQAAAPGDLCAICNCNIAPALYEPSSNFSYLPGRPRHDHIWPSEDRVDINEFMRQTILDMYCARQHLDSRQALKLLRRSINNLSEMMSWSLASLELGRPTVYMTTATSPNGKSGPERPQYFRRHGRVIRSWMAQQAKVADKAGLQLVWIVAEDEVDIDPLVARTLRRTGVPYVYFAYGQTKSYGNAQKNAVLQIAYALSRPHPRGLLGHGPVYGLDDDNKILPDLITHLTKVVRVGVFPVGNLGSGWEKPILDDFGVVIDTDSPWRRKFSLDYGGYTFNTSLLGTIVSGPSFWKHSGFGGEDQFVEQLAASMRDLEPLCGKSKEQDCHFVWHNEALTEMEKMTDEEEIAYVQKYGAKKLFQQLGFESKEEGSA